jgi:hypothetical protein
MPAPQTTLETILDEMRNCIKVADFSGLAVLAPQLDQAVSKVRPKDAAELQRLKAKAAHNATLLEAARRGIGAARRRLDEARRAADGLQTYDGKGRRFDVATGGPTAGRF